MNDNDPHVVSLRYQFSSEADSDKYDDAAPLKTTLGPFDVELADNTLIVRPRDHYPSANEAKEVLEPLLRSWESSALLQSGRYKIRFNYVSAEVIDRNPPPTDESTVHLKASAGAYIVTGVSATLTRRMSAYPAPDPSFQASPLTDEFISRLKQFYDGREPLTSMANWVLTRLEKEYGNRDGIADTLNVSSNVINDLGKLAASTDPQHGRKAKGNAPSSLSPSDLKLIQTIVERLIQRVGEVEASGQVSSLPQITRSDFY